MAIFSYHHTLLQYIQLQDVTSWAHRYHSTEVLQRHFDIHLFRDRLDTLNHQAYEVPWGPKTQLSNHSLCRVSLLLRFLAISGHKGTPNKILLEGSDSVFSALGCTSDHRYGFSNHTMWQVREKRGPATHQNWAQNWPTQPPHFGQKRGGLRGPFSRTLQEPPNQALESNLEENTYYREQSFEECHCVAFRNMNYTITRHESTTKTFLEQTFGGDNVVDLNKIFWRHSFLASFWEHSQQMRLRLAVGIHCLITLIFLFIPQNSQWIKHVEHALNIQWFDISQEILLYACYTFFRYNEQDQVFQPYRYPSHEDFSSNLDADWCTHSHAATCLSTNLRETQLVQNFHCIRVYHTDGFEGCPLHPCSSRAFYPEFQRIGEASNPGPTPGQQPKADPILNIYHSNPTSLVGKEDHYDHMYNGIHLISETSTTYTAQRICTARFKKNG